MFNTDDKVEVIMDRKEGVLRFKKNGFLLKGQLKNDLLKGTEDLYFAVYSKTGKDQWNAVLIMDE